MSDYSTTFDISDRLIKDAFITGISPQLAPGLVVGDFLVACSDYTGHAGIDPYPGPSSFPVAILGNVTMSPSFYQSYGALTSARTQLTATRNSDGATIVIHTPEGQSGAEGGHALLTALPQNAGSWGLWIFRMYRITVVPANPAVAYSGDLYEMAVQVPFVTGGPVRPAAPTIAAFGFLNGDVPQINVSGN